MNIRYVRRRITNYLNLSIASIAMFIGIFFLAWILISLFIHGFADLRLTTVMQITQPPGNNGGLLNAIIGSLLISGCAVMIGTPLGILAGIYLAEFGQFNFIGKIARFTTDILLSAPSIIIGLFIYEIYVVPQQHFSGWAGSFALAIIVIPIVTRTTENILVLIPNSLREAAAALGAPPWKVILHILLRVGRTGILTGILLATARISGETAPLLFTALNNQFWSINMNEPMANLPTVIFQYAMSPYQDWHQLAWSGALIITLWVLTINIIIRVIFKQKPPLH